MNKWCGKAFSKVPTLNTVFHSLYNWKDSMMKIAEIFLVSQFLFHISTDLNFMKSILVYSAEDIFTISSFPIPAKTFAFLRIFFLYSNRTNGITPADWSANTKSRDQKQHSQTWMPLRHERWSALFSEMVQRRVWILSLRSTRPSTSTSVWSEWC